MQVSGGSVYGSAGLDDSYRPLPFLYLGFLVIWFVSASTWMINTWRNRHFQANNLQWTLASVPLVKALQLALSFLFWYSCFNRQICSLWMSFGVYVTGVLFQTASLVSFLLISHGYCIVCERLSIPERRITASLGCALYLILVGYKAAVPYFTVLLWVNYFISFYVIFHHIAQNLSVLREQMSFIEDEDIHIMRDATCSKYLMFKKFQGAMQMLAVAQIVTHMNLDSATESHWFTLLVRESVQLSILLYIGWTFRSQEPSPRFSLMPNVKPEPQTTVPPVYSIEMDVSDFKDLASNEWHIGVQTPFPRENTRKSTSPPLILVQHPHAFSNPGLRGPSTTNVRSAFMSSDLCWQSHQVQTLLK
ncbi:uncharacterized protein [Aristolochia californica]|uniref:uncharacterized protein n=1 Tax=Aristolochia californica TaxID=171875 RepID=UPI0035D9D501